MNDPKEGNSVGKETFRELGRTVKVTVRMTAATAVQLEVLARQTGMSRSEVLDEAARDWAIRRERSLTRASRAAADRGVREAREGRDVAAILDGFARQMRASPARPLTSAERYPTVGNMAVRETPESEQLSVVVPADVAEELRQIAAAHERTVAAELRVAIREHLGRTSGGHDSSLS
ncbi:MAG TPA: ribbon-helix-helix protein, CopG family [Solirubrobacteraceae bacterium]